MDAEMLIRQDAVLQDTSTAAAAAIQDLALAVLRQAAYDVRNGDLSSRWFASRQAALLLTSCGVEAPALVTRLLLDMRPRQKKHRRTD